MASAAAPAALRPVIALDLGGTQVRAAYITPELGIELRRAVHTRSADGSDAVTAQLVDLARGVIEEAARASLPGAAAVGISAPGPLDAWRGVVVAPPNLAAWRDVPLADDVEDAVGLRVFVERDTNVAVLAESRYGAAADADTAIYITVSTGIGGGLVVDGRLVTGRDSTAGEAGHMTVELDGPLCGDGQRGHVEAIGSGIAIAREGKELIARGSSPILAEILGDAGGDVSAKHVAEAAARGDAACSAVLDRAFRAVGAMCASLVNLLNPEVIVLGGGIAEHQPPLYDVVREEIDRGAFAIPARRVRVMAPRFGPDVSLVGAMAVVTDRLDDPAYLRNRAEAEPIRGQT